MIDKHSDEYLLQHYAEERSKYFNAVAPPIVQTSNFVFENVAAFREAIQSEREFHLYSRGNNPVVRIAERKIAALQGTEDALMTGSGAAAISNAVIGLVKQGDHIICIRNAYTWATKLMEELLSKFGVEHTFVDGSNVAAFEEAIQSNTKMLYLESPTSVVFDLVDLSALSKLAKLNGFYTVFDNSYFGPTYRYPVDCDMDLIIHSASKYVGGHSDVIAGAICGRKKLIDHIFRYPYMTLGNVLSPMDAWLLIRGLRTLPLRLEKAATSAKQVMDYLESRKEVHQILFPNRPDSTQYSLGQDQGIPAMSMFSVQWNLNAKSVDAMVDRLKLFKIAVSWGGHESLVLPLEIDHLNEKKYLTRLYVGLDDPNDLIKDLEQALGS